VEEGGTTKCHMIFSLLFKALFFNDFGIKKPCLKAKIGFTRYFLSISLHNLKHKTLKNSYKMSYWGCVGDGLEKSFKGVKLSPIILKTM